MSAWPTALAGIAYGGDYNPEQWPRETWAEDIALMREAGVSVATVGVFAWALLEPEQGHFELDWLGDVLDLLHEGGIRVDLATATASPPPWLSRRYPETLPQRADGTRLWPGGRQAWCPSSPVFRERSLSLVTALAERFHDHPGLAMWHVSNELGGHNARCFCDVSAAAFRAWLQNRYGDLADLNAAWGTAFWSQHYGEWEQVLPPRSAPTFPNPTQQLDFARFCSDQLLDQYRAERDVLRRLSPGVPVTTNLMVMSHVRDMDYFAWGPELDFVAQDHYLEAHDPDSHVELSWSADLTRGVAGGAPWFLMEHSTSAVNWQPRNVAKQPGQMLRNSLAHVARGSDAVCFFQWRASRAGAEKFHSALVPHAGTDSRVWREVVELGRTLQSIGEVAGSRVEADVAILFDWQARWAAELDSHPSADVTYVDRSHALYRALWDAGVTVDLVHPDSDLSAYRLVLAPTLYLVTDASAARLASYVERGGHLLVTYWSGIVDEHDHVRLGGYPGAFRELLGLRTEEFYPLRRREEVRLAGGMLDGETADVWTELLTLAGAKEVSGYADGPLPGVPALTSHPVGAGTAWYLATRLRPSGTAALVRELCASAGVAVHDRPGVEVVRRVGDSASYLFVINHTDSVAQVSATGTDLVSGRACPGTVSVAAGAVAVIREERG
ncbi:MAG TPA: beta-galactosidase [Actinomycetes bacterium]|nr:beta-galactosidase [Actinomycetes bacterium]